MLLSYNYMGIETNLLGMRYLSIDRIFLDHCYLDYINCPLTIPHIIQNGSQQ